MLKISLKLHLTALLILSAQLLNGQSPLNGESYILESYTFGSRFNNPIKMNSANAGDRIKFSASNLSYFPYEVTIKFSFLTNLSPAIFERKAILQHGNTYLFDLSVVDKNQPASFDYMYSYGISLTRDPEISFPYLIPIGQGKTVQYKSIMKNGTKTFLVNFFNMNPGDTVYAIRKGIVTALPDDSGIDRIRLSSLEVLHNDGTLAIYHGVDCTKMNLTPGQIVFPGQPIGYVNKNELELNVVAMNTPESFKSIEIYYADQNAKLVSSRLINNFKVYYPEEIIEKELTSRETRKYKSGKLF